MSKRELIKQVNQLRLDLNNAYLLGHISYNDWSVEYDCVVSLAKSLGLRFIKKSKRNSAWC